jgi:NADH:ubiquinone oxidoreductase subunit 3 (subunit A)
MDNLVMMFSRSVPLYFLFFLLLITLVYFVLNKYSAKGPDNKEKFQPYTGGQNLPSKISQFSYQTFFRLGLLFGIVHVAALMIATLPLGGNQQKIGAIYLVGVGISIFVLAKDIKN